MKLPWRRKIGGDIRAGDEAMRRRDWSQAVIHFSAVLTARPDQTQFRIQLGHALKETGDLAAAEREYSLASRALPGDAEPRLHHARVLFALKRHEEGLRALVDLLAIAPDHHDAYRMLIEQGGRRLVPTSVVRRAYEEGIAAIATQRRALRETIDDWDRRGTYPLVAYDAYRRDIRITPPPENGTTSIHVIVDGRNSAPSFIRSTLLSLVGQTHRLWRATVVGDGAEHPVASLAAEYPQISFSAEAVTEEKGWALHIAAGTLLDRAALAWFSYSIERTGCIAAWADEDLAQEHWRDGTIYARPTLWGAPDPLMMIQSSAPPSAVLVHSAAPISTPDPRKKHRQIILEAMKRGPVAHIPRVLVSVLQIPERATIAPLDHETIENWSSDPRDRPPATEPALLESSIMISPRAHRPPLALPLANRAERRIAVLIPTRDAADMLKGAIDSLSSKAARPDLLDIVVADNRSSEPVTAEYLDRIAADQKVRVVRVDEAFNWARINNLMAAETSADYLVFANNDIEMLSENWDDLLIGYLDWQGIGVVGARLLYPDHSIQHAGMIFGTGDGPPRHEGVMCASGEAGPQERYDLTRRTSAVTGAFMGVERRTFERLGGFDATHFAVGYNDIDFCLTARAAGLDILYAPAIELIHLESKTRGFNVGRSRVAWDQGELRSLYERWGPAMLSEPAYNPQWSRDNLYDGYREPSLDDILGYIDLTARRNPWLVIPAD